MCDMTGCNNKPMPGALTYALGRIGLPRKENLLDRFGEPGHFCSNCAVKFAARVAIHEGILSPDALDKAKIGETRKPGQAARVPKAEPAKYYPSDSSSRLKRLVEIEQSLRAPTLAQREAAELQDRLYQLQERAARIKPKPVDNRAQLFRYLQSKGLDPIRLGNW